MIKKLTILLGSPRKRSNSSFLAKKLGEIVHKKGIEVETFLLHEMDIRMCIGCEVCHGEKNTGCILRDQMQEIYPSLQSADAILLAFPIYYYSINGQMKVVIERFYPFGTKGLSGKKLGVVTAHAETGAAHAIRIIEDICDYCDMSYVGKVEAEMQDEGEAEKQWMKIKKDVEELADEFLK